MLMKTWLHTLRRRIVREQCLRRSSLQRRRSNNDQQSEVERLEERALLTTLAINADNLNDFLGADGGIVVHNGNLGTHDAIAIESVAIDGATGDAININLSNIDLRAIAIENVILTNYTGQGIDIDLAGITTGVDTVAIEDIQTNAGLGVDINLDGTEVSAVTIDDSSITGIAIDATGGSEVSHGVITENTISAPSGVEGIMLNFEDSVATDFYIINNTEIGSASQESIRVVSAAGGTVDGLKVVNNSLGEALSSNIEFRVDGDTFQQPFTITNTSATANEQITRLTVDVAPAGLIFDEDAGTGQPFEVVGDNSVINATGTVLEGGTQLEITFDQFNPGDTFQFLIDLDPATGNARSVFGDDLIPSTVTFETSAGQTRSGTMIGDPDLPDASQFVPGIGLGSGSGILFNADAGMITDFLIQNNEVGGATGDAILIDAANDSQVTGLIDDNDLLFAVDDGIEVRLEDSDFAGGITRNVISGHGGHGINFTPVATRSGVVDAATDTDPIIITSLNHGLSTGETVVIQGMVNQDGDFNYPGNGTHTITRLSSDQFILDGVSAAAPEFFYDGGGSWFVPGAGDGLVTIDLQGRVLKGPVTTAINENGVNDGDADPTEIVITSIAHGLTTGDTIRVSNVEGNTAANGIHTITVIDADTFSLDGTTSNGAHVARTGDWTGNVVADATNSEQILITSPGHGLRTGEQIRIEDVNGNTAANGTHTVTVLNANQFQLDGVAGNGDYTDGGFWTPLEDLTAQGDRIQQLISGNSITANAGAGIFVDLPVGTRLLADIMNNSVIDSGASGLDVTTHSFGLGVSLPLDPADTTAVPIAADLSFDINVGSRNEADGNEFDRNTGTGIKFFGADAGTGTFLARNNVVTSTLDDVTSTRFNGDGILALLEGDNSSAEATALFVNPVIDGNTIGVDDRGNAGSGITSRISERTRMQSLSVVNNAVVNNMDDGFQFERTDDAAMQNVTVDKNTFEGNAGDGIDLLAINTSAQLLEFSVTENQVTNNDQYGVRVRLEADAQATLELRNNTLDFNGADAAGTNDGFHPDDDEAVALTGNQGAYGGIGILGVEQVSLLVNAAENVIRNNVGDGISVDARSIFDTISVDGTWSDNIITDNTLTGFRDHGIAFGSMTLTRNVFDDNGEDGFRAISNVDEADFFRRRIGGFDKDIFATGNYFGDADFDSNGNAANGLHIGQGISAVLGDGTVEGANFFDYNGEDGLKVTQTGGFYLDSLLRRRAVEANLNFFRSNGGNGIDLGESDRTEGGNFLHGDEVLSDSDILIGNATIDRNGDDGIEYLADSLPRELYRIGGGQDDLDFVRDRISSLTVRDSRITRNEGRGIDILNRVDEDSRINIINSQVLSNSLSGIYVVNTASDLQEQAGPDDPLHINHTSPDNNDPNDVASDGVVYPYIVQDPDEDGVIGIASWRATPNIELRVQDNIIQSNGSADVRSTITVNDSDNSPNQGGANGDQAGTPGLGGVRHIDWAPNTTTKPGSLGGLVIRVGTAESNTLEAVDTAFELGQSGVDAEVWSNEFDGNFGSEVFFDSFVSVLPHHSFGNWNFGDPVPPGEFNPFANNSIWTRDPLSRFDLVFRENTGTTLDVVNGFAFLDNWESVFKSRSLDDSGPPNATRDNNPDGTHVTAGSDDEPASARQRNATRTLGYSSLFSTWQLGDDPISWVGINDDPDADVLFAPPLGFDGEGTPTWRVESDFDTDGFTQTNTTLGFSDFFDTVTLGNVIFDGEEHFQWDTGRNSGNFTGETSFSLDRGDVFNVRPGETPILPDSLENNDTFIAAHDLGSIGGAFDVSSVEASNNLTIETKGDRDYYSFTAASSGPLTVDLAATDLLGDSLSINVYEIDETQDTEEIPLIADPAGLPVPRTVAAGGTLTYGGPTVNVVAGRSYIVEVFSDESANTGFAIAGKTFNYGTVRSYGLTINTPAAGPVPGAVATSVSNVTANAAQASPQNASLPGDPTVDIVDVAPDPRDVGVGVVTIDFSEDVEGFDIADLTLTRDGVDVDIAGAVLAAVDPNPANADLATQYTLDLSGFAAEDGAYVLTIVAADSGIVDSTGNGLAGDAVEAFTVNPVGPVAGADSVDANPGDGVVADITGSQSLRAAIIESNAIEGNDVVELAPGVYPLTIEGVFEDAGLTGDLDVTGSLTIRGAGAGTTTINGMLLDRVFHVHAGAHLTLEGVTVTGGTAFDGGAFFVDGTLTLIDVEVIGNTAYSQGGGIYISPTGSASTLRTGIVSNTAGSRGGGVFNGNSFSATNTTISTNSAVSRGGGIFSDETSEFISSTVAFNVAGSSGAGIGSDANVVGAQISNTLIAANTLDDDAVDPTRDDLATVATSIGFNLIGALPEGVLPADAGLVDSDMSGTPDAPIDALLAPLAVGPNGTSHHPLDATSPAIDAGSNDLFVGELPTSTDQIGNPRLIDGDVDAVQTIDIGAVEFFVTVPVPRFTANPNPVGIGEPVTFDASASNHSNAPRDAIVQYEWDFDFDGTFSPDATGVTAATTYTTPDPAVEVALRVTDNNGASEILILDLEVVLPRTPVINNPPAFTTDSTPTIEWTNITGVTFNLQVESVNNTPPFDTGNTFIVDAVGLVTNQFTIPNNLPAGTYRARVQSQSALGGSEWSPTYTFTIGTLAVTGPATTGDTTPTVTWTPVSGATAYEIWINREAPTFEAEVVRVADLPGDENTFTLPEDVVPGTYSIWVRSRHTDGYGDWSAPFTMEIQAPTVLTPGDPTIDETPVFSWNEIEGATSYKLWVNQVDGPSRVIYEDVVGTSFEPTVRMPEGDYRAWIQPILGTETGPLSQPHEFTISTRATPTPLTPIGLEPDATPTFIWSELSGAVEYTIFIRSDDTGTVITESGLTTNSFTPDEELDGSYTWWVWGTNDLGRGGFQSDPANFTVLVPAMTAPAAVITNTQTPTFEWTGNPVFVRYELIVDNLDTRQERIIHQPNLTSTTFTPVINLTNSGPLGYSAQVRAFTADGEVTRFSDPLFFRLDVIPPDTPVLTGPEGTSNGVNPTFTWLPPSQPVESFELLLKKIEDDGQPIEIVFDDIPVAITNGEVSFQPTNLSLESGQWRFWVRAISPPPASEVGPYSAPLDFTVAAAGPLPLASGLSNGPLPASESTLALSVSQSFASPATSARDERGAGNNQIDNVMSEWPSLWWDAEDNG